MLEKEPKNLGHLSRKVANNDTVLVHADGYGPVVMRVAWLSMNSAEAIL